jgi:hypothetical protein
MNPTGEPSAVPPAADKTTRTARPRRRWWRRWSVRLLVTVLGCIGLAAANYGYRHHQAVKELEAVVAELDRTDPGWRLADIEAARAVLPDDKNSALVMGKVVAALPARWPTDPVNDRLDRFKDLPPNVRMDAEDADYLRETLKSLEDARRDARKVADMPNGRYPITYQRNILNTLLPHVDPVRKVFYLLQLELTVQAQDGDLAGALRSCRAMLNAARSLGDEPFLVTQLVRMAGIGITVRAVERVLAQGEPEPEELLQLQNDMQEEERFSRFLVCIRGERAGMHELFDALECGDVTMAEVGGSRASWWESATAFTVQHYVRSQHPTMLALWTEGIDIAARPAHERAVPMAQLTSKVQNEGPLVRLFWPAITKIEEAARRTDGDLRCGIVALAVERYRHQHGRFPETLQQLVPDFLPAVPLDAQDGQPLRYQRLADRVVIYSLCRGGSKSGMLATYDPDEPSPPGEGVAVHLFDVKHRRQPPTELLPPPVPDDDDPQ